MVSVHPTVSLSYTQNVRDVKLSGRDFGIRLMDVQMKLQSYFAASNIFWFSNMPAHVKHNKTRNAMT